MSDRSRISLADEAKRKPSEREKAPEEYAPKHTTSEGDPVQRTERGGRTEEVKRETEEPRRKGFEKALRLIKVH